MERRQVGFIVTDIVRGPGISVAGERSVCTWLSDEDLRNSSLPFEKKHAPVHKQA